MSITKKTIKVVEVISDSELVINAGRLDGVQENDKFLVYALGKELIDPDSGESLGTLEIVKGRGVVAHIQERMCTIHSIEKKIERVATKRIIKRNQGTLGIFAGIGGGEIIEEIDPSSTRSAPFDDPSLYDLVRKI